MRREILTFYGSPDAAIGFGIGAGGDTMKKIDLVAEKALVDVLEEHKVSCTLISEETGTNKIGSQPSEFYVTTDPVDGTTNAVRGIPFMATAIAVSKAPYLEDVETAIVSDLFHNVTYTAQRDQGAFRNGEKIQPSQTSSLEEAVVGVDFNTLRLGELVAKLEEVLIRTRHLRHFGANALEICYVADGATDAFIDIRGKLRVTDIAASYLIILEAGGIMVTPEGTQLNVPLAATQRVAFIAAANKRIYENIKKFLV
ncbi:MAG: fructose 1,6-bisphosphatase [Candidatus Bathyarchaeota archaeon]|nr:fructose 1,6-bisphosphatase [Candidatus Bathyarchaeota archaeon]